MPAKIPKVALADGTTVPALGLGTWTMGEHRGDRGQEVAVLKRGIDLGMTLIDTAEMYGDGGAEEVVAQAISGRRDEVFLVSKVYPQNAGARSAIAACERSLRRLRTDRVDLYLLHWRGSIPLPETVAAFERLRREGKIARWGVSNFDLADMMELFALPDGVHCATNQVLYHLGERGIEWELLPWMRARAIPLMAYSPFGHGALLRHPRLTELARSEAATPAQLALAWVLGQAGVFTIPQSSDEEHLHSNLAALDIRPDDRLRASFDAAFPPPSGATPLAML